MLGLGLAINKDRVGLERRALAQIEGGPARIVVAWVPVGRWPRADQELPAVGSHLQSQAVAHGMTSLRTSVHEEQVDILYPMQGEAEMFVEGTGTFLLKPGIVVRVPKGTKHKISNVTEELLIYDVFQPATL